MARKHRLKLLESRGIHEAQSFMNCERHALDNVILCIAQIQISFKQYVQFCFLRVLGLPGGGGL